MIILQTKNVIGHGFIHKGDNLFNLGIEILDEIMFLPWVNHLFHYPFESGSNIRNL